MNKRISMVVVIIALLAAAVVGYFVSTRGISMFNGLNLLILSLIILSGVIAIKKFVANARDEKSGISIEDELTLSIKYKSGYYAYFSSMYLWFGLFIFKDKFPDIETLLGVGILSSALLSYIMKIIITKGWFNEQSN